MVEINASVSEMTVSMDSPVHVKYSSGHIPYHCLHPRLRWVNTETYELSERGQSVVDRFFNEAQIAITRWLKNPELVQGVCDDKIK